MSDEHGTGTGLPASFAVRLPAQAQALADLRQALTDWLVGFRLPSVVLEDVVLAVHEAAANATEHAYRDRPTADGVVVTCRWVDGSLSCSVADRGGWRSPGAPGDRGRGLGLIRTLADEVEVRPSGAGTTVHMSWQAPRG